MHIFSQQYRQRWQKTRSRKRGNIRCPKKKKDDKNRWRYLTVAFRVSPEENEELNMRVKLSGAETKREYIIQSVLHQQVIAKGNPLMLVTFRRELQHIEKELERLTSIDEMDSELLTPIRSMLEILEGFRKDSTGDKSNEH